MKPPAVQLLEEILDLKNRQEIILQHLQNVEESYKDELRFYQLLAQSGNPKLLNGALDGPYRWPGSIWFVLGVAVGVIGCVMFL